MQIISCLTTAATLGLVSATRSFQNASIVSDRETTVEVNFQLNKDIELSRLWLPFATGCQQH
jgi:hypothetical protein